MSYRETYTAAEYETAIAAAKDIKERTGRLSSKDLLNELISRTGKPREYWHILDIMLYIKIKEIPYKQSRFKTKDITEEHKKIIIDAAKALKKEEQKLNAINSSKIKLYVSGLAKQTPQTRDILEIGGTEINKILINASYSTRKQHKPRGPYKPRRNRRENPPQDLRNNKT